ncbi:cell division protein ZipA [Fluoribacter dumoffii]|uniref:Cell division protein ZipA n=1 Tax=Fluoribacter dumoffii TaxID=463 RepID=A0A377GCQ5_9GAMM|nr:cell division protein ZipA C-terminal FtsZ-binding domain-containing protein [Fluoribacter dumoffii]KTC91009.1 cell division protein [Fluoribacter dumoffii NY 23]MCW8386578.1 cell division protein ZipA [Fluoribacter dumoffii]MCW8419632.1 cell division protein ZipA [Fluoribacter dumoffii]MCW8455665.1 cell division protein ZipA [Fluoribacter dumoffii]MCW8460256.1 cell division protein ZipA [Fluoribacter dumoffii]
MQANWSLILNVLLLIGVIAAIGRLMKARRQSLNPERYQPSLGTSDRSADNTQNYNDDIIAVRKINIRESKIEADEELQVKKTTAKTAPPRLMPLDEEEQIKLKIEVEPKPVPKIEAEVSPKADTPSTLMMFLLAKENRQFAGYELLQTVLAAGLRFGEGHLFHRHQFPNGQGPVLCSLAAATATGVFDLQNIGAFSVRGLCLYMHSSKNPGIDVERFAVMLETARQLSEGLDAHLLDDQRKPLTEERIARYHRLLQINQSHLESAAVSV